MKALGLDLGDASLGIAISDREKKFARGLENYKFSENYPHAPLKKVIEYVHKEPIDVIVLGYPLNMNGSVGPQAQKSLDFKALLEEKTNIEVVLLDERLTSSLAKQTMVLAGKQKKKRQKSIDQTAAIIILQNYLDQQKRSD